MRDAVEDANNELDYPGADTIIITDNIVLKNPNPIIIEYGKVTIVTEQGKEWYITRDDSSFSESKDIILGLVTYKLYSPIFSVVNNGELVLGEHGYGSLNLEGGGTGDGERGRAITKPGGGAVYVDGGSFTMNDGVTISGFGLFGTELTGNGAVYVNTGTFIMNGGRITESVSMKGSGVYIGGEGAVFEINGGRIDGNGHDGYSILWIPIVDNTYGGGVFVESEGIMTISGDKEFSDVIYGNFGEPEYVYNDPFETGTYTIRHFFYDIDGENPVEDEELQQTAVGKEGDLTNAEPLSIPGYKYVDPIVQKEIAEDSSTVVDIYYEVYISYIIEIPDNLVIDDDSKTGTLTLTPTELWILETGEVSVSVSSKYEFALAYAGDPSVSVSYELSNEEGVLENGDSVAGFTLQNPNSVSLTAQVTGHPPYVGAYNDLLTFTAEYIDPIFTQN